MLDERPIYCEMNTALLPKTADIPMCYPKVLGH